MFPISPYAGLSGLRESPPHIQAGPKVCQEKSGSRRKGLLRCGGRFRADSEFACNFWEVEVTSFRFVSENYRITTKLGTDVGPLTRDCHSLDCVVYWDQ